MFASIIFAAVLSAAPVAVDIDAMKAGQLPLAGTPEEADTCAAETKYVLLAMLKSGKATGEEAGMAAVPMVKWLKRAAAFRAVDVKAYSNDKAVVDAALSLQAIEPDTHATLAKACMSRLSTLETK